MAAGYDLIVIGGGAAGLGAARGGVAAGARTLLVSAGEIGGESTLPRGGPAKTPVESPPPGPPFGVGRAGGGQGGGGGPPPCPPRPWIRSSPTTIRRRAASRP